MRIASLELRGGERRLGLIEHDAVRLLSFPAAGVRCLADVLHSPDPAGLAKSLVDAKAEPLPLDAVKLLAPVDRQEIWAAGVTYKRSQVARMEESESGASHYDKVYSADRPELFFKSQSHRVSGPGDPVRVRFDSDWSVPEPEFTLVISPAGKVVGYTIGNDMSARDIEGENPLYLPQAKVYNQCCAVGPCILLATGPLDMPGTKITLRIDRLTDQPERASVRFGGQEPGASARRLIFEGETDLGQFHRKFDDLAGWLFRENDFPDGAMLLTGTGIVPPDDFSLENGDTVHIEITGIGTLTNPVVKS